MKKWLVVVVLFIVVSTVGVNNYYSEKYIDGEIVNIEVSDNEDYEAILIIKYDNKTIKGYLNGSTYIGNSTKSPPKPISFLKIGMDGYFVYKKKQGINYISSMNMITNL